MTDAKTVLLAMLEDCDDPETIVRDWSNCRDIDISYDGGIVGVYVADPQYGHYLDEDECERLIKYIESL